MDLSPHLGFTAHEQLMGGRPSMSTDVYNLSSMLLNCALRLSHMQPLVLAHTDDAEQEGEYVGPYMTVVSRS